MITQRKIVLPAAQPTMFDFFYHQPVFQERMDSKASKQLPHKERVKERNKRRIQIDTSKPTEIPNKSSTDNMASRSIHDQNVRAELLSSKRDLEKNQRRSRTGKGRGMPKKGGAGGKGTWGKPGGAMDLCEESSVDKNDPNYDSENEGKDVKIVGIEVMLSAEEAKPLIKDIIVEYFEHGDTDDVADSASEMNIVGTMYYLFAKEALYLAFDTTSNSKLEAVSVLISDLYGYHVLLDKDIEQVFNEFLAELDDISLDCPEAQSMLGKFMARCVADDCLAPKFVNQHADENLSAKAKEALHIAHGLITMKHGLVRLDSIWNAVDRKPVKHLVKKIKTMIAEYQDSYDFDNVTYLLHELGIPHFHHEIVYEIIVKCLEENSIVSATSCAIFSKQNATIEANFKLLGELTNSNLVTLTQFESGLKRVFEEIVDLAIDIPGAFKSLEAFCERCKNELSILDPVLYNQLKADAEKAFKDQELPSLLKETRIGGADSGAGDK